MANSYPRTPPISRKHVVVEIADISSADQRHFVPGFRGKISKMYSCLGGAISGSDATLTAKISGTAVTGGAITVAQSSSAAGDVDEATPTAKNVFTESDHIEIETDGASTGAHEVLVTFELDPV